MNRKRTTNVESTSERYQLSKPLDARDDYNLNDAYDWSGFLDREEFNTPPVEKFTNAPLNSIFHHLKVGLKIEVPNKDYFHQAEKIGGVFWVASVIKIAGYKALCRYEGYANDNSHDFWINFCSADLHPVGWCASEGKPLVPPKALTESQEDWKGYLVKRLTGSRTLPPDWHDKILKSLRDCPFRTGLRIETIDRTNPERVRPATIENIIGSRLHVAYSTEDSPGHKSKKKKVGGPSPKKSKGSDQENEESNGEESAGVEEGEEEMEEEYWVFKGSPLIFPVGWALRVGYGLHSSKAYRRHCEKIIQADPDGIAGPGNSTLETSAYDANDSRPSMFDVTPRNIPILEKALPSDQERRSAPNPDAENTLGTIEKSLEPAARALCVWQAGMKLEILDPLDMNAICVATVDEVLKQDWLKLRIDGEEGDNVCFHKDSPYLFPAGFCHENGIELTPPKGSESAGEFKWEEYLKQTNAVVAPAALFAEDTGKPIHGFEAGMKIEAVDMLEPKLVCVATVVKVIGSRLLKIHFDGWEDNYDQMADYRSPDIFPIGWAETVAYKLEGPKVSQEELEAKKSNAGSSKTKLK